jgi:hypothetical protein
VCEDNREEREVPEDCVRWSRADLRLAGRAVRERWNVPLEVRNEAVFQALRILTDPDSSAREKNAAGRLVGTFDASAIAAWRARIAEEKLDLDRAKLAGPQEDDLRDMMLREAIERDAEDYERERSQDAGAETT